MNTAPLLEMILKDKRDNMQGITKESGLELRDHKNPESKIADPLLVFGTVSLNRYKYPDGYLLKHAYIVNEGKVTDLTKTTL